MLMTNDWVMKLADFGEARAVEKDYSMTMVGTLIFEAPDILKGDPYDSKVDSYSFSICLFVMVRVEKNILEYFLQSLRKLIGRKSTKGVSIAILNSRLYARK